MGVYERVLRRQRQDAQPSVLRSHPASREWIRRLLEMVRERPAAPREEIALPLVLGSRPPARKARRSPGRCGAAAIGT